jgi:hypothetical protein
MAFGGCLKRQCQTIPVLGDTDQIECLESVAIAPDCPCRDIRLIGKLTL